MLGHDPSPDVPARADADRLVSGPFVAVTTVTFLFFLYVGILVPLVPRLVEEHLGGSELDIGLNLAAFSLSAIAVRPLIGVWGDRYGRRVLMVGGAALAAVGAVLAAWATSTWTLLPLRALAGMGEGALFVGGSTMISDLAPPHRRAEAASYFSVAVFGGIGIGPIAGESLVGDHAFDRGLYAAAICAVVACACACLLPKGIPAHVAAGDDDRAGVPRQPLFHRGALRPGYVLALGMAGFATFNAFIPEHARAVGLDGSKWVFGIYSLTCLVVRVSAAKLPERIGLLRCVNVALVFLTLGLLALFGVANAAGVFGGAVLTGVGMSFLYPALMALTVNAVSERERSRAISTFTMFFEVGTAAGGLLFGWVAELTTKRGGFLAGSAAVVVGVVVLWRVYVPHLRRCPLPAHEVLATAAD